MCSNLHSLNTAEIYGVMINPEWNGANWAPPLILKLPNFLIYAHYIDFMQLVIAFL